MLLKNLYGDSMPSVNKQIDKQIGTGIALAISTNDPDLQYFSFLEIFLMMIKK
jgi:hypothetical protein